MERTVLVTGSSSGIGRATVEAFLDEEWTVYATARDTDDITDLGELENCRIDSLDVTDEDDIQRVVERVTDEMDRVDCLVNNAGYGQLGPVEDVSVDAAREQYEVNVFGPHRLLREILPEMRRQEDGTVVNVTSVVAQVPFPGGGVYAGSKAALSRMGEAMRAEVEAFGIDVVEIEPGPVDTQFDDRAQSEIDGIERSGAYDAFYDLFEDWDAVGGGDGPLSVPAETVADEIVNAASATDPAPRYPVGPVARAATFAPFLPAWARTWIWSLVRRVA